MAVSDQPCICPIACHTYCGTISVDVPTLGLNVSVTLQVPQILDGTLSSPFLGNGSGPAPVSGRLAYVLGLKGPAVTIGTVCSASLVAADIVSSTLRLNKCNAAVIAGVNLILGSEIFYAYGDGLASDGRCKTFDAAANGLGRGEAVGAVVVRRHNTGQGDDNFGLFSEPLASIRGTAVNQDGQSASM